MQAIKEKELILNNVVRCTLTESEYKYDEMPGLLKRILLDNGLYTTSPGILRRYQRDDKVVIQIAYAVNRMIIIRDKNCEFFDQLRFNKCLFVRVLGGDNNVEIAEKALTDEAETKKLKPDKEGCIFIYNKIPGGRVIDVYLPVTG